VPKPPQTASHTSFGFDFAVTSMAVRKYRIVNVGEGGVGKSAISIQFINGTFVEEYDPTIEDSYRKQMDVDDVPCIVDLLDTAGQEEFSSLREAYMRTGNGFLIVYAINSRDSFDKVYEHYQTILRATDSLEEGQPIVLLGNKKDLEEERKVPTKEAERFARKCNMKFFETSALDGSGITAAYQELIRMIRIKYGDALPPLHRSSSAPAQLNKLGKPKKVSRKKSGPLSTHGFVPENKVPVLKICRHCGWKNDGVKVCKECKASLVIPLSHGRPLSSGGYSSKNLERHSSERRTSTAMSPRKQLEKVPFLECPVCGYNSHMEKKVKEHIRTKHPKYFKSEAGCNLL